MKENSVLVIVEHFLNSEGRAYFDGWLEEVQETLEDFEGFELLCRIYDPENSDRTLLRLDFTGLDLLGTWSTSDAHEEILERIRPYQEKKQRSQVFTFCKGK